MKKFLLVLFALFLVGSYFYPRQHVSLERMMKQDFMTDSKRWERLFYFLRESRDPSFVRHSVIPTSETPVDIVIPLIEKDLEVALYTVRSIRAFIGHKVGKIYIISPESQKIRDFCKQEGCVFVLEGSLLPSPEIQKQSGWFVQQFLKLNADQIVENEHYLVVDGDTFFLRPQTFMEGDTYFLNVSRTPCPMRKTATAHFLGNKAAYKHDFVNHHMLFSKKILGEMKKHIEKRFQKPWEQALLDGIKKGDPYRGGFSEYELYATYLTEFSGVDFRFLSSANIGIYKKMFFKSIEQIIPVYAAQYKSASLHVGPS